MGRLSPIFSARNDSPSDHLIPDEGTPVHLAHELRPFGFSQFSRENRQVLVSVFAMERELQQSAVCCPHPSKIVTAYRGASEDMGLVGQSRHLVVEFELSSNLHKVSGRVHLTLFQMRRSPSSSLALVAASYPASVWVVWADSRSPNGLCQRHRSKRASVSS